MLKALEQEYGDAYASLGEQFLGGLGEVYLDGLGGLGKLFKKDYNLAFNAYQKAANRGSAEGYYGLGFMYAHELGVVRNVPLAIENFEAGAAIEGTKGGIKCQYYMGVCYSSDELGIQDLELAFKWYNAAAIQGHADAQYFLGKMYYEGLGSTPTDYSLAFKWVKAAADQDDREAEHKIEASLVVAHMYDEGEGTEQDPQLAALYYGISAELGFAEAQFNLAVLYSNKLKAIPRNDELAFHYYKQAADKGHAESQLQVYYMYASGLGTAQDHDKALEYYQMIMNGDNEKLKQKLNDAKNDLNKRSEQEIEKQYASHRKKVKRLQSQSTKPQNRKEIPQKRNKYKALEPKQETDELIYHLYPSYENKVPNFPTSYQPVSYQISHQQTSEGCTCCTSLATPAEGCCSILYFLCFLDVCFGSV